MNERAEIIGVSVAFLKGGQNLNFAIPSNYVKGLLATDGPETPLSQRGTPKAQPSLLADLGSGQSSEGVVVRQIAWEGGGGFGGCACSLGFSLHNTLSGDIKNVSYLVVFRDARGDAIDAKSGKYMAVIPAGLAKRTNEFVSESVKRLTEGLAGVEFRIFDFQLER